MVRWGLRVRLRGRQGRGEERRWLHRAESQKPETHRHSNTQRRTLTNTLLLGQFKVPRKGISSDKLKDQLKKRCQRTKTAFSTFSPTLRMFPQSFFFFFPFVSLVAERSEFSPVSLCSDSLKCRHTSRDPQRESPMLITEWEGPEHSTQHTVPVPPLLLPALFSTHTSTLCCISL